MLRYRAISCKTFDFHWSLACRTMIARRNGSAAIASRCAQQVTDAEAFIAALMCIADLALMRLDDADAMLAHFRDNPPNMVAPE